MVSGYDAWFRILWRMWKALSERNLGLIAAGVAYFALLAIFPGVAALVAIWGLLADPGQIEEHVALLEEFVPEDGMELLSNHVDRLVAAHDSTLGWATVISLLATLWMARRGVGAMIQGLNAMHGETLPRGGLGQALAALGLTLALMGVSIFAMSAILVLPVILSFVPIARESATLVMLGNWAVALLVGLGAISLFYRYAPNRKPRTPWFSPGLAAAVLVWGAASLALSWFMSNFDRYDEIYGSIAAVIALMLWFYVSVYAILLGGLLNAEVEREAKWRMVTSARTGD